ncbi:GNAT family N-acetyltransferase [Ideonella sp. DXS22W]|uniref:GNAT family N-acetyltransferase n=1 Tax=Pseudaquabacterium inlustre TaxID=2984192 RepID=A0ABU9CNE4_9BURK
MNPFSSAQWHGLYAQHIVRDQARKVCPPPLCGQERPWVLLQEGRRGTWRAAANYYTSLVGPADDDPRLQADVQALLGWFDVRGESAEVAVLDLAPLALPVAQNLGTGLRQRGWYVRHRACFGNWYLLSDGRSFEDFMAQRPSQLQSTWRRKARRFQSGSRGAAIEIIVDPERVAAGMDAFEAIYAKSWKRPEPYPAFIRAWAHACAEQGWLRLGVAWVDSVPVAAQIWFTVAGKAHIFKLAYDEAYAQLSPGTVLSGYLFRQALDVDRVHEIDYLSGDDVYKRSWMSHRRERFRLLACDTRHPFGLARAAVERAREWRLMVKSAFGQ